MVSGFRELHIPRAWRVYLATGFHFREKNRSGLGSIGDATRLPASYLVSLLSTDDERDQFSQNFVFVLRTTTRHVVSFIDFNSQLLANFQT